MNIKTNSKDIKNGDIFIALKGIKNDGHDYIEDAINNGASYIISDKVVGDTTKFLNELLSSNFSFLINKLCLIGITGTNGKTTSCFLIYEILRELNIKSAYIGTIGFYIDNKIKDLNNTTPDILTLYNLLLECVYNDVKVVVMEVSSHSLKQNRLYGIKFDYVVFTNLTKDHLDFHSNMTDYLESKKKLFNMVKEKSLKIVNIDDSYSNYFDYNMSYGFKLSDYHILSYKLCSNKLIYKFKYKNKKYKVKLNVVGKYNIYNSIISIIILNDMGISIKKSIKLLKKVSLPNGRMDIVKIKKAYAIIDYAHTPDAVENILNSVNEFKKGKIITIIGCGGDRDKTKRKDMGLISTNLSNYVIFTNDNPRSENPINIINDITKDLKNSNYEIILDRHNAIIKGIGMLNKNDILLILGKGHEEYQIINNIRYHFNDKEEVLNYIKKCI